MKMSAEFEVDEDSFISPLINSIFVQSWMPVFDFPSKTFIDCSNSRHSWLHEDLTCQGELRARAYLQGLACLEEGMVLRESAHKLIIP